jgi:hypothetical protein
VGLLDFEFDASKDFKRLRRDKWAEFLLPEYEELGGNAGESR